DERAQDRRDRSGRYGEFGGPIAVSTLGQDARSNQEQNKPNQLPALPPHLDAWSGSASSRRRRVRAGRSVAQSRPIGPCGRGKLGNLGGNLARLPPGAGMLSLAIRGVRRVLRAGDADGPGKQRERRGAGSVAARRARASRAVPGGAGRAGGGWYQPPDDR